MLFDQLVQFLSFKKVFSIFFHSQQNEKSFIYDFKIFFKIFFLGVVVVVLVVVVDIAFIFVYIFVVYTNVKLTLVNMYPEMGADPLDPASPSSLVSHSCGLE